MYSKTLCIVLLACLLVDGGWCLSGTAMAQLKPGDKKTEEDGEGPAKEKSKNLWIRKLEWRGTPSKVKAPEYTFRNVMQSPVKTIPEWHMITVTYDTGTNWIDQVVVNYHVLLLNEKKEGSGTGRATRPATREKEQDSKVSNYTLLEGAVSYVDVPQSKNGQSHMSMMFIRPNTIERYGEPVAAGVEIVFGDEVVSKSGYAPGTASGLNDAAKKSGRWWGVVAKSDQVRVRSDSLLNRSQTPFIVVNYMDEESIQQH